MEVEPGSDVLAERRVVGTTLAELQVDSTSIALVDAHEADLEAVCEQLQRDGKKPVALDPKNFDAKRFFRDVGLS